ncbi:MAG: hemerythrin domain-containing protein [Pseudomonadota bacterium]
MADETIFARLKDDHDKHRTLLDLIDKTEGDSEGRRELFGRFKTEVTAHAAAEEETLYSTMLGDPDLRHEGQHSVAEHKELDDYLTELEEMDYASTGWLTRFRTMKDRYLHHIEEEEKEMFVAAAKGLSDDKAEELAETFEKRKPAELERAS